MPDDKPPLKIPEWRRVLARAKHAERLTTAKRAKREGAGVFEIAAGMRKAQAKFIPFSSSTADRAQRGCDS